MERGASIPHYFMPPETSCD